MVANAKTLCMAMVRKNSDLKNNEQRQMVSYYNTHDDKAGRVALATLAIGLRTVRSITTCRTRCEKTTPTKKLLAFSTSMFFL